MRIRTGILLTAALWFAIQIVGGLYDWHLRQKYGVPVIHDQAAMWNGEGSKR